MNDLQDKDLSPAARLRHFKGGTYRVFGDGFDASHESEPIVIYISEKTLETWVRKRAEFTEIVDWPDGQRRTRFVLLQTESE